MSKSDGGAAFPEIETDPAEVGTTGQHYGHTYSYGGMKLRDYFAAKAMPIVGQGLGAPAYHGNGFVNQEDIDTLAVNAYALADAMLKAREKAG